jgi:hypothetical protein
MLQLEYKNLILLSLLRDSLEIKYILKVYKIKPVLYILCADGFWKIGLDFVLFIQIFLASKKKCPKIHKLLIESILKYGQIDACQVLIGRQTFLTKFAGFLYPVLYDTIPFHRSSLKSLHFRPGMKRLEKVHKNST